MNYYLTTKKVVGTKDETKKTEKMLRSRLYLSHKERKAALYP